MNYLSIKIFSYRSFWARGSSIASVKNKGGIRACIGDPIPVELRLYSLFFDGHRFFTNNIVNTMITKQANAVIEMIIITMGLTFIDNFKLYLIYFNYSF